MNVYRQLLIDRKEKRAWIIDHGAMGVYVAIDEFELDNDMTPIKVRGACFQGDDLLIGKNTTEEIEEKVNNMDSEEKLQLLERFDCRPSDLVEHIENDDDTDYCGLGIEDRLDELGMTFEFIDYAFENELDNAFGEFEDIKPSLLQDFEDLLENAEYSD